MDVAQISDATIAYRHRPGPGRTIVFANSLGSDQSIWDHVIATLPAGYGILTYDLRGHGQSSGEAESIDSLAEDLSQLLDHLGLGDVLFCGVSIGGLIGQVLAAKRPDILRGAVLCNTALKIGTAERWQTRIDAVTEQGLQGFAPEIVKMWFGTEYRTRTDRLALHRTMIERTTDTGYLAACRAIRDADLTAISASITLPVLCIAGQEDQSVPPSAVKDLAAQIPGARLETLDGVGHLPCLEVPKDLARQIAAFDPQSPDLLTRGLATRRAVLGDTHVDRAEAAKTEFDQPFQTLITEGAWGRVWSDETLSRRERSMLTLALLAATGNFEEIPMHIRATANTGASPDDVMQALLHVAIYAGVPKANHAIKLAKQTYSELGVSL